MTPAELADRFTADADRHDARYHPQQTPLAALVLRARVQPLRAAAAWMREGA